MNKTTAASAALLAACAAGCIHVKTESEIKPIHITMDVNLKVDKELDKAFSDEAAKDPRGDFAALRKLLDRKVAGICANALIEARDGATDEDRLLIAESNARRLKRFHEVAKSSGASVDAVQRRHARKMIDGVPAGSGTWVQGEDGAWSQK